MKRRKRWRPGGRPRLPTGTKGGNRRRQKIEVQSLIGGKGELNFDADLGVSAVGAGGNRKSFAG